ncbi:hypothetical protein ROA7450_03840 [Roseovarius albus]|uniref:Uncharacterized protein n=1 Tax=Roseovarius albus TaxID=1247867 RepID=A0A1X7A5A3_9RHOB|nr:hypothetical protein ROA7450_03840 [Roseovarius albus]
MHLIDQCIEAVSLILAAIRRTTLKPAMSDFSAYGSK